MKKILQQIVFVLISMLVTFIIAMGPIAKVDGFNVLPWLDIPFHIWGGLLLGILAVKIISLLEIYRGRDIINKASTDFAFIYLLYVVGLVVAFGLLWEAWEFYRYYVGHVPRWGGVWDTVKDIFDDIVGGILAYAYNIKFINRHNK